MAVATQAAVCTRCGRSTAAPQLLEALPWSFQAKDKTLLACPRCIARAEATHYLAMRCLCAVVLIAFVSISTINYQSFSESPGPFFVFALLLWLFEPLMILLHESAHAMAGKLVRLRVFGICLGSGPLLCKIWLGDFSIMLHLAPTRGSCVMAPVTGRGERWRFSVATAAGPLVHIVLIALVWMTIGVSLKAFFSSAWIPALFLVNLRMALNSLVPIDRDGQILTNDGRLLLQPVWSELNIDSMLIWRYAWEIDMCLETGRIIEARNWLQQAGTLGNGSIAMKFAEFNVLGAECKWADVRTKSMEWHSSCDDPSQRAVLSAWSAMATIHVGGSLDEADALCNQSMSMIPWDPAVETVRAFVSLAQGRDAQAEDFLKQAGTPPNWAAKTAAAHIWAELYRRKGNIKRQRKWESRALSLDPAGAFRVPGCVHGATV